jgi:methionyl aminopeptidase
MIIRKSPDEIQLMREAGRIVAETLGLIEKAIKPGLSTIELDRMVDGYIKKRDGRPAFKGYRGFPASVCISINEGVVHGIPGSRSLRLGDIVSVDVGVEHRGCYADAAATFPVGNISPDAKRLIEVTKRALEKGINMCRVGNHLSDISHAIQRTAEEAGYSVVREFVGHGIGRSMHEDPQIPNYGEPGRGPRLEEGMTFALEPMINIGSHEVKVLPDKWGVVTLDESLSAHFEHTVAIAREGPLILTSL